MISRRPPKPPGVLLFATLLSQSSHKRRLYGRSLETRPVVYPLRVDAPVHSELRKGRACSRREHHIVAATGAIPVSGGGRISGAYLLSARGDGKSTRRNQPAICRGEVWRHTGHH